MKKITLLLFTLLLIISCVQNPVKKPKKFIEESKMEDIIYDLAVFESAKSQGSSDVYDFPSTKEFLKKKYNIDSLTYVENTQYYAADIDNFKHLYDRVKNRLEENSKSTIKTNEKMPKKPKVLSSDEQGVVK